MRGQVLAMAGRPSKEEALESIEATLERQTTDRTATRPLRVRMSALRGVRRYIRCVIGHEIVLSGRLSRVVRRQV